MHSSIAFYTVFLKPPLEVFPSLPILMSSFSSASQSSSLHEILGVYFFFSKALATALDEAIVNGFVIDENGGKEELEVVKAL